MSVRKRTVVALSTEQGFVTCGFTCRRHPLPRRGAQRCACFPQGHIQRCPRIQDRGRCRDPGHRSHLMDSRPRM